MGLTMDRPCIALTLGDPAGIGPEICLRALRDPRIGQALRLILIGPARLRPADVPVVDPQREGVAARLEDPSDGRAHVWVEVEAPSDWEMGRAHPATGRVALQSLRVGHELALAGRVSALVTAPVSKEALALAGERVEGQTELLGRWCSVQRFEMLAIAGPLCVMLLTRHLPLRDALARVTRDHVIDRLLLFDESLRHLGVAAPRLALAGLNPHAGEHGVLGTEELEILEPALTDVRARGLDVTGPVSPDSVFLQAARGRYDGVLALYHDQAFIPVKLLSNDGGVTVIAGLPYLRVSPVHGTAFDIAGRGIASAENLISALLLAADWSTRRRRA